MVQSPQCNVLVGLDKDLQTPNKHGWSLLHRGSIRCLDRCCIHRYLWEQIYDAIGTKEWRTTGERIPAPAPYPRDCHTAGRFYPLGSGCLSSRSLGRSRFRHVSDHWCEFDHGPGKYQLLHRLVPFRWRGYCQRHLDPEHHDLWSQLRADTVGFESRVTKRIHHSSHRSLVTMLYCHRDDHVREKMEREKRATLPQVCQSDWVKDHL